MTGTVELRVAVGDYDRTQALVEDIPSGGLRLHVRRMPPAKIFREVLGGADFDVAEMSLANYIMEKASGSDRFVGLPIFLAMGFPQSLIFLSRRRGRLESPMELRGGTLGVPEYSMTTPVWQRGILADRWGLQPDDFTWFVGGREGAGRLGRIAYAQPQGLRFETVPSTRSLAQMAADGELDAVLLHTVPEQYPAQLRLLWDDPLQEARRFFDEHRFIPVIHCLVMRRTVYHDVPWAAASVIDAFRRAKDRSLAVLARGDAAPKVSIPILRELMSTVSEMLGDDFWPYGLEANARALERLVDYLHDQGLIAAPISIHELFVGDGG